MSLKMSQLVAQSGVSKSTILYYIKEGLLPEPQKPKPNVHLYDAKTIKILEFIKYFQENLGYSIAHIKEIVKDNKLDFSNSADMIFEYLSAMQSKEHEDEVNRILSDAKEVTIDPSLIEAYERCATQLAKLEYKMGAKILTQHSNNENNRLQKVIFDIILKVKPYIFNRATIQEHKRRVEANTKDLSC